MSTDSEIAWLFELEVSPENQKALEELVPEMVAETRKTESGSRAYQTYIGEGGKVCVYERYDNSDAALEHMKNFGEKFAGRFMALVTPVRFTLLGTPSAALMEAVGPIGAVVHAPVDGYVK
jgi:quinol monooxygenase YgiN